MNRLEELRNKCKLYHEQHPEVWDLFVQFSFELILRGFKHYSARAVWHRIRWETDAPDAKGRREGYKLPNNHTPFYSRAFMKKYPKYDGFFRIREQISAQTPAREPEE